MTYKFTPKTFDECYKELSDYLHDRGIATEKIEGDHVYELAKTYAQHEQDTFELDDELIDNVTYNPETDAASYT
tara:strand:+ start:1432 stop:1653 length:222 start_codon:yes stop_codon:yes gene_type:complete